MAQLAAAIPKSGGAYTYASAVLSPSWGFSAGIAFLLGKIGSVAAIALTVSIYFNLGTWVAVLALWGVFAINSMGVNRTALGARLLSLITLVFLFALVFVSLALPTSSAQLPPGEPVGVLTAAGFIFFAFAGYARVATLGGEVDEPGRNVPRAIAISLGIVFLLYLLLALTIQRVLGIGAAYSERPVFDLASLALAPVGGVVIAVAAIASLGSLLALLAGMGRLAATMGQDRELPKFLAKQNSKAAPWVAELVIVLLATLLILSGSIITTIGLSSFAVLTYYSIANLAAFKQATTKSNKILAILGFATALVVAISVPVEALVLGAALLLFALLIRLVLAKLRPVS
jgi:APA family basic amino acid/polyamine antiporter